MSITTGMLAARTWLADRGLTAAMLSRWHANILLGLDERPPPFEFEEASDTRFRIEIYSEEWGVFFCHAGRGSWVRVTDIPFAHGRDDFQLLPLNPALKDIGALLRRLETEHRISFRREHAQISTNVDAAEAAIRRWVESL